MLRIQTKKVRYAAEFFAAVFPGKKSDERRDAFVTRLEKMQDALPRLRLRGDAPWRYLLMCPLRDRG
jgi:CHAD domain-containing protein